MGGFWEALAAWLVTQSEVYNSSHGLLQLGFLVQHTCLSAGTNTAHFQVAAAAGSAACTASISCPAQPMPLTLISV